MSASWIKKTISEVRHYLSRNSLMSSLYFYECFPPRYSMQNEKSTGGQLVTTSVQQIDHFHQGEWLAFEAEATSPSRVSDVWVFHYKITS